MICLPSKINNDNDVFVNAKTSVLLGKKYVGTIPAREERNAPFQTPFKENTYNIVSGGNVSVTLPLIVWEISYPCMVTMAEVISFRTIFVERPSLPAISGRVRVIFELATMMEISSPDEISPVVVIIDADSVLGIFYS